MEHSIAIYFLYFIITAICGWIMEIMLQLVTKHKLASRGFLIGPYCPIYGCGAVLITLCLTCLKEYPVALFFVAILICGVLEYFTSYIMEKIFHARWWDYSENKFNINGRICLSTIIPFGILGLVLIYIVNPFIFNNLEKIPENVTNIIAIITLSIFAVDLIISAGVVYSVRKATKKINEENPKDNTEELSKKVKEFLKKDSIFSRRLVTAFPKLTAIIKRQSEIIKKKTTEVKQEVTNKASKVKGEITQKASEVKEEITKKGKKYKGKYKKEK